MMCDEHDAVDAARRAAPSAAPSIAAKRSRAVVAVLACRRRRTVVGAVVDADDEAVGRGEARGLVADAAADVERRRPGRAGRRTSRYPASWSASRESGVAPSIGRSPVSFTASSRARASVPIASADRVRQRIAATPVQLATRRPRFARVPPSRLRRVPSSRLRDATDDPAPTSIAKLGDIAATAGLRRIAMLAWRDLDDPEAGGSEVHASRVASLWAEAGIEVTMRTSYAAGHPQVTLARRLPRDPQGRPLPRVPAGRVQRDDGLARRAATGWSRSGTACRSSRRCGPRRPHVAWLHHVHAAMWEMTLPPRLARARAHASSRRRAAALPPHADRHAVGVVEARARRRAAASRPTRITVVPPGIDPSFSPGGDAVADAARRRGRPARAGEALRPARSTRCAACKPRHPALRGGDRRRGLRARGARGADRTSSAPSDWISLPGRVDDDELVDLYRRAWVLASASAHEGWGMTITEAAACGTPAVATRIAGPRRRGRRRAHRAARRRRRRSSRAAIDRVLADDELRARLAVGARSSTRRRFTWEATARGTLEVLAAEALRRRRS